MIVKITDAMTEEIISVTTSEQDAFDELYRRGEVFLTDSKTIDTECMVDALMWRLVKNGLTFEQIKEYVLERVETYKKITEEELI